ncbi:hypothetical protein PMAYCL1PPCAC_28324, partial [Pristionchus mayeri]
APQRLLARGHKVRRLAVMGLGHAVQGSVRLSLLPQSAHPQVVHWLLHQVRVERSSQWTDSSVAGERSRGGTPCQSRQARAHTQQAKGFIKLALETGARP